MKLLYILDEIKYSGAEVMLCQSAVFFQKKGFEIYALSTGENAGDYSSEFIKSGILIKHIPFRKEFSFFYHVYQFIRDNHFHVIHIHTERAFFFYSLIAWLNHSSCIIRTVHNVFTFNGFLRIQRFIMRQLCRYVFKVKFISVGDSVSDTEKKYYNNSTEIIYNWVDESRYYPVLSESEIKSFRDEMKIPQKSFVFCTVGACSKVKRHNDIIQALFLLRKKYSDIFFLHAGDGELNNQEKELVRKLKLSDSVLFLGQINHVRKALIASDLFVMTSDYEGLSVSCIEALKCGLSLIVYQSLGLVDTVLNQFNGFIIENNPEDLARKIEKFYQDRVLLKEFGLNSIEYARKKFNTDLSLEKLYQIYINNI